MPASSCHRPSTVPSPGGFRRGEERYRTTGGVRSLGRQMRDSSPDVASPGVLAGRMAEDGYLFFRGLVEPTEILQVRHSILERLAGHSLLAPGSPSAEARPQGPALDRGTRRTCQPSVSSASTGLRSLRRSWA